MLIRKLMKALRRVSGIPNSSIDHIQKDSPIQPQPSVQDAPDVQEVICSKSTTENTFDLVLYGRSSCPYCVRVDRVIEELDIEDKITRRNTGFGTEWRTDLRHRTGSTQVPCLFIDGEPMFESLDIIAWMRANLT